MTKFDYTAQWEALLDELDEYLEQREDVRDGSDGVPQANEEMNLLTSLRYLRTAPRAGAAQPIFVGVWGPEQIAAMRDCKPGDIQVVYPLDEEWNAALDAALRCYSPDDLANDWADKIRALKRDGGNA